MFQRRVDNTVDFYREWDEYVIGFGDLTTNLWAGLDKIHPMTGNGMYDTELHVYMESFENESREAMYSSFSVGDASSGYLLNVSGYSGDAGDSMSYHSGMKFSTHDKDQDEWGYNCGQYHYCGWWFKACYSTNPNGRYGYGNVQATIYTTWQRWKGLRYSLKTIQFKVRRI